MMRLGLFFFLFPIIVFSQDSTGQDFKKYPFINLAENKISNDSIALQSFYKKMIDLNEKNIDRVNIVHIGDSHIQADFLSGTVRVNLQKQFGNSGRGFVFPQRVARSNEPYTIQSWSNTRWRAQRNVIKNDSLPIGLAGFTIYNTDTNAVLKITLRNQDSLDYSFNKLTLFHSKGLGNYDVSVCDNFNCEHALVSAKDSSSRFTSKVFLQNNMNEVVLKPVLNDSLSSYVQLFGILFENDKPGVLYNSIGVNGAEFRHYNGSVYFNEQLKTLNPDLIILSLGTNEAFANSFNAGTFISQVDTLINNLKINNPQTEFLITIPGDHLKRRRYKNHNLSLIRETLIGYSLQNNIAYWDMFTVMGGLGSINKWYVARLAAADRIHMNRRGYELQGKLLSNALLSGLAKYISSRQ